MLLCLIRQLRTWWPMISICTFSWRRNERAVWSWQPCWAWEGFGKRRGTAAVGDRWRHFGCWDIYRRGSPSSPAHSPRRTLFLQTPWIDKTSTLSYHLGPTRQHCIRQRKWCERRDPRSITVKRLKGNAVDDFKRELFCQSARHWNSNRCSLRTAKDADLGEPAAWNSSLKIKQNGGLIIMSKITNRER